MNQSEVLQEHVEQISILGTDTFNLLQTLERIKAEMDITQLKKPHIAWQLIRQFIVALSTEDPNPIHFETVRETLKVTGIINLEENSENSKTIIDILARKLNEHCRKLIPYLAPPKELQAQFEPIIKGNGLFSIIRLQDALNSESLFIEDKLFIWDTSFLKYLKTQGKKGKEEAKRLASLLQESTKNHTNLSFWFNMNPSQDQPFYLSQALIVLTVVTWEEEVKNKINLITKGIPALTKTDQKAISDIFSPYNQVKQTQQHIQLINQEHLLGAVQIPLIPEEIFESVFSGVGKLNTLEGHRVLRYLPRTTFKQFINGESDYRIIRRPSFSYIANELGLQGKSRITNVKDIFYAIAYLELPGNKASGNLIALRKQKSEITNRWEALEITVGSALVPYRACETFKNGESNLLIPILPDPPLVGANQYHAGQYLLQMLIIGEFSQQSVNLATNGVIYIPQQKWESFAQLCGLSPAILNKVQDRWLQSGSDGAQFLEQIEKDYYTLGKEHEKEFMFLKEQGSIRIKNINRGKLSSKNRLTAKNRKS